MPSMKDLKNRISSVKNTQQTTRAMKLVSAAKLRRAQDLIVNNRPYARKIGELIALVSSMSETPHNTRLIQDIEVGGSASGGPGGQSSPKGKVLLVLVTSDRGLCGSFNANIVKRAWSWRDENESKCESVDFAFIGKKGRDYYRYRGIEGKFSREFGRTVTFGDADLIAEWMIEEFLDGKYDQIKFVYNEFKNAMVQGIVVEHFLPVGPEAVPLTDPEVKAHFEQADLYLVKPNHHEVLEALIQKHFAIQVYRILLESQASEHGARMIAMENATKNAQEMIKDLALQYNKQRQAGITKELLEIISGSESQKGA